MNDNENLDEFQTALAAEFESPSADDTTPPAPAPASSEDDGEKPSNAVSEDEKSVPPAEGEKPKEGEPASPQDGEKNKPVEGEEKQETPEEKANREAKEAAEAEPPKPLTQEDIRAAIAADRSETQARADNLHTATEEIINTLYPEGIDQNIYDTNGKVVKNAQDIVDRGLINERTGEPFTYEEAQSFMMEAQTQMAKNVEELRGWAEEVSEKNVSLVESNERVMTQWGDILKAMPKLADELATEYITTHLEFHKSGQFITKMTMSPERYYARALAPYRQLGQALVDKQNLEAAQKAADEKAAKEAAEAEQDERNGFPPQRGTSATKANTGDPMLDALVDELAKG